MTTPRKSDGERSRSAGDEPVERSGEGLRIGRVFGIAINVDPSLAIIFGLIVLSLGWQVLPVWHPEWSALLSWFVAFAAAFLFFVSVAAHELAHAVVGRRHGIPVRRITLFLFGGLAHMEKEPPTPKSELWMAAVGPITSLVIGVAATVAAWAITPIGVADPVATVHSMGPLATLLLWLGPVNVMLGIFNLVPGFPLDGGRMFRAVAWWATGDRMKATRWATNLGRLFGWALVASGVAMALGISIPFFGSGLGSGIWLILIGWFLARAARTSFEQLVLREALGEVSVAELMRRHPVVVTPDASLEELARRAVETDQEAFPVVRDGELLGVVAASSLARVPPDERYRTAVTAMMRPLDRVVVLRPGDGGEEALDQLQKSARKEAAVVDRGRLLGVVRLDDIFRWLALRTRAGAR